MWFGDMEDPLSAESQRESQDGEEEAEGRRVRKRERKNGMTARLSGQFLACPKGSDPSDATLLSNFGDARFTFAEGTQGGLAWDKL